MSTWLVSDCKLAFNVMAEPVQGGIKLVIFRSNSAALLRCPTDSCLFEAASSTDMIDHIQKGHNEPAPPQSGQPRQSHNTTIATPINLSKHASLHGSGTSTPHHQPYPQTNIPQAIEALQKVNLESDRQRA